MVDFYEIPVQPINQTVSVDVNGVSLSLTFVWNYAAFAWNLDIGDSRGNPLACGIPIVLGTNLLGGYEYIGIGAGILLYGDDPTYDNFGTNCRLFFVL